MRKSPLRPLSRGRREGSMPSSSSNAAPSTPPHRDPIMELYSAPTEDSLDEIDRQEVLYSTLRGSTGATQSTQHSSSFSTAETPPQRTSGSTIPRSSAISYPRNSPQRPSGKKATNVPIPPRPPTVSSKTRSRSGTSSRKSKTRKPQRDFQHEQDAMRVSVRTVDLNQRYAFEPTRLISIKEWQENLTELERMRKTPVRKKISPSLQHLELLHKMQSVAKIRQLDFSSSMGINSDIFVPWDDDLQPVEERVCRPTRSSSRRHDGRYRSIDPLSATMAVLPSEPPALSKVKRRLPIRSDVGFPNASSEEIELKQAELQMETTWEEASPRLVVLVTSDVLGTAIFDEPTEPLIEENIRWNGGGLVGMPLAGPELVMAMERNSRLFASPRQKMKRYPQNWKPNRTSMLAPPLDASYSSTVGWRPRPFHDRPPGRMHYLACPLRVSFDIGNVEPLVCSLSLYNLPPSTKDSLAGKISEDFWFPGGDWEEVTLNLEAACELASGSTSEEVEESWRNQKHKAVFSYDPLDMGSNESSRIYVVLQVHKVSQARASAPYHVNKKGSAPSSPNHSVNRKKGIGGRIKSLGKLPKVGGSSRSAVGDREEGINVEAVRHRSKTVHEMFGTQFLTPLCFGFTPLLTLERSSKEPGWLKEMEWPNGIQREMQLYSFPNVPESQDAFVERLISLANEEQQRYSDPLQTTEVIEMRRVPSLETAASIYTSLTEEEATPALDMNPSGSSMSSSATPPQNEMRSRSSRIFKTPKKKASADLQIQSTPIGGTASIFTSTLGVDFVQSMLSTPQPLRSEGPNRFPRVFVDVSGDCAIMMNLQHPAQTVDGLENDTPAKKRSNLVRLPQSNKPSGYIDASEIREVLYLPPRADKHYDVDVPGSLRSFLNLLYLYPRLIRVVSDRRKKDEKRNRRNKKQRHRHYSIRIRLVRTVQSDRETWEDTPVQEAVEAFHNPAPWAGPSLLKAVYTKIPQGSNHEIDDTKAGIALRDEVKLNLPMVLDGSYFLEFTLFEVELDDDFEDDLDDDVDASSCGISVDIVGEAVIPLSNSALREASSGVRITTVIPNGNHRVAIGDFQLQVETRLVSSIHVNDTTVATALRDFPYARQGKHGITSRLSELALAPSRSIVGRTLTAEPLVDLRVPFHSVFASASESAVYGYFSLLIHMHLCNMVNRGAPEHNLSIFDMESDVDEDVTSSDDTKFISDNMQSLFEIVRKAKLKLQQTKICESEVRVQFFLKGFVDSFDEELLLTSFNQDNNLTGTSLKSLQMERSQSYGSIETPEHLQGRSSEDTGDDGDFQDEAMDAGALLRNRPLVDHDTNSRIYQTLSSTLSTTDRPFSRVAYGASKTDRMRLEAEMHQGGGRQLFDDDETVATFLTSKTLERNLPEQRPVVGSTSWDPGDNDSVVDDKSIYEGAHGTQSPRDGSSHGAPSFVETGFAKRVRTAAQVMIAPCMTPALSTVLVTGTSSPVNRHEKSKGEVKQNASRRLGSAVYGSHLLDSGVSDTTETIYAAGTDTEDDRFDHDPSLSRIWAPGSQEMQLRGSGKTLLLSPAVVSPQETNSTPYVYESIMILWLKTWVDQVESENISVSDGARPQSNSKPETLFMPEFDLSHPQQNSVHTFFAHMDFLLPLCLKSFVLRCDAGSHDSPVEQRILDSGHLQMFLSFVEMLARGLMAQALSDEKINYESDKALLRALSSSQIFLEFLIGLIAVVHPEYISQLIAKYFGTLREYERDTRSETSGSSARDSSTPLAWTEDNLRRVRCSRHLRLHAVELLSVIPNFLALNFPKKFAEKERSTEKSQMAWTLQTLNRRQASENTDDINSTPLSGRKRLPSTGWLANIVVSESLHICSLSCETVVAEAMAHIEISQKEQSDHPAPPSLKNRPGASLKRHDLLQFQAGAIQAITCVYELTLRRHAMDARFQTVQCRSRIASVLAPSILDNSFRSVRWLARMEATHKVRSLWLLCLVYVLQEAPRPLIRQRLRTFCSPPDFLIHRFIRLLRLSSATFQCFADQSKHTTVPSTITGLSSWLMQETFNTICASTNMLVDECVVLVASHPHEQTKLAQGVLDLLLHIIAAPQSSVTHLRALGGALQALNQFGVALFLEATSGSLQHWVRVVLTWMNSLSLSVRTIATDFVVSLFGAIFSHHGNVDEIMLIFVTLIPEVVAREIALFGVGGLLSKIEDVESAVWPLRRALADIEEANPLDDNRVDPQLAPALAVFCRACQAVIDGVLVELRLEGNGCAIVGSRIAMKPNDAYLFDADEESLFEAANFFVPETAPLQRLRWLLTLKRLHELKGQRVEAGETLILCARTISDSIPHLRNVWRPSRFPLWYDDKRSLWIPSIGKELGHPDRGNAQVMEFADSFLEPGSVVTGMSRRTSSGKLPQPTVPVLCMALTRLAKEAVSDYLLEDSMEELAYTRLESLLKVVMNVVDDHSALDLGQGAPRSIFSSQVGVGRKQFVEENAALRRVSASLNAEMTRLADKMLLIVEDEHGATRGNVNNIETEPAPTLKGRPHFVRVLLSGEKPARFVESTTIPTFLEWDTPCICRIPAAVMASVNLDGVRDRAEIEERICAEYGKPLRNALLNECDETTVICRAGDNGSGQAKKPNIPATTLDICVVHMDVPAITNTPTTNNVESSGKLRCTKRFFYRKPSTEESSPGENGQHLHVMLPELASNLIEHTVAHAFPSALSRQRALLTSEFFPENQ